MEKYDINLNLMEMVGLASACSHAIDREHRNFVRILNENGEAIKALELAREKILLALKEDNYHLELDLMEIVQLYAACNMAWHYECAEREKQHTECRLIQYGQAIQELEDAREKILAALRKGGK
jgi:hypothetical protein